MLKHPIPWTGNHHIQNHGPKNIGGFAQPNIGSKKISRGAAPDLIEGGYPPPSNPLDRGGCHLPAAQSVQRRGGSAPPLTPQFTT